MKYSQLPPALKRRVDALIALFKWDFLCNCDERVTLEYIENGEALEVYIRPLDIPELIGVVVP